MTPNSEKTSTKNPLMKAETTETTNTATISKSARFIRTLSELWPTNDCGAGEQAQRLLILFLGLAHHVGRKLWCRRLLVPADGLQIIAHKLLVERGLQAPG